MRIPFLASHKREPGESDDTSRPTRNLMKDIQRRDWDAARHQLVLFPPDAKYHARRNGKTPLHVALMNRAPREFIDQLLEANPDALFVQDSEGWTPLHVIILYGGRDDEETTLQIIRRGGRVGGCLNSRYVGSPLHLACRHSCSISVLIGLLEVGPNQARLRNEAGMTPANLLWKTFLRQKSLKEPSEAQMLLEQLCLLLSASIGSALDPRAVPSFEQALAFQQRYADETDFVRLLLWFHPRVICDAGVFPVHRASAYEPTCRQQSVIAHPMSSAPTVPQDPLKLLMERFDDISISAACSRRDDVGRLPLHWAVSTGKRKWSTGLVRDLANFYPNGLQVRDPTTGLYPFQLAASVSTSVSNSMSEHNSGLGNGACDGHDSLRVVETIFELFRAFPQVIS